MARTSVWGGALSHSPLVDKAVSAANLIINGRPRDTVRTVLERVCRPHHPFGGNIRALRLWVPDDIREFLRFHLVLKSETGRSRNRRARLLWLDKVTERGATAPLVLYGSFYSSGWHSLPQAQTPDGYVQTICLGERGLDSIIETLRAPEWAIKFINT